MTFSKGNVPWNIGIKGYNLTEETKEKIRKANMGHSVSKETREKISEAHKGEKSVQYGKPAWNKGKPFSEETKRKMSEADKGRTFSKETIMKFSESHRREKHWNWKGGISLFTKRLRKSFVYRQWRDDVFTRDDFTCQRCGKVGCYLEAHHCIKSFSNILQCYEITTIEEALECQELWNINNGETLCKICHKSIHKGARNKKC